jgi:hypothetical protein
MWTLHEAPGSRSVRPTRLCMNGFFFTFARSHHVGYAALLNRPGSGSTPPSDEAIAYGVADFWDRFLRPKRPKFTFWVRTPIDSGYR